MYVWRLPWVRSGRACLISLELWLLGCLLTAPAWHFSSSDSATSERHVREHISRWLRFFGEILSIAILDEPISPRLLAAGALMAIGLWLHLTEKHIHPHVHVAMDHEHEHVHDSHHQHEHPFPVAPGRVHTHLHHHEPMTHTHEHYPDTHHQHGNEET